MSKEEIRRVVKVLCGAFGVTMIVTGLVFLWFGRDGIMDAMAEKKTAYSALEVGLEDLHPGDHVTLETSVVADYVLQRTETGKRNGYTVSQVTWRYYLIPVIKSDEQGIYCDHMVLVSRKGNFQKIDDASDAFFDWWNSEDGSMDTFPGETVLSVDGRVAKLTSKELKLLEEYYGDMDYKDFVAPYVVKPLWENESKDTALMGVAMGVSSEMTGVILLIIALLFGRKKGTQGNGGAVRPTAPQFEDLRKDPQQFKWYIQDIVNKLSAEQKAEVLNLINSGQTIPAIKAFRDMTGVALIYAKETIDHYEEYLL